MKILIIEDDNTIVQMVARTLEARWPEAKLISTFQGEEGVELTKKEFPDIIILDLWLPDIDGLQVVRKIRDFTDVPVVILTARGGEDDRVRGLEEGADDYIIKPFSNAELVARLKSLMRRTPELRGSRLIKGRLKIDLASQTVSVDGRFLKLGPRHYELLNLLVTNARKVLSKQLLMKEVFPEDDEGKTQVLEVYINILREKLGDYPNNPKFILDEGGTGYKFVDS